MHMRSARALGAQSSGRAALAKQGAALGRHSSAWRARRAKPRCSSSSCECRRNTAGGHALERAARIRDDPQLSPLRPGTTRVSRLRTAWRASFTSTFVSAQSASTPSGI